MRIKKWIDVTLTTVLIILLGLVTLYTISTKINGAPKILGYEFYTVLSGSMEPTFQTGSVIAIHNIENDKSHLNLNDIVTYKTLDDPNTLITHRIVGIEHNNGMVNYITKGDNNDGRDPKPIPSKNVVGTYANITIPYLGYMLSFAKSKVGITSVIIIPAILLIVWQLISIFKAISRKSEEGMKEEKDITNG